MRKRRFFLNKFGELRVKYLLIQGNVNSRQIFIDLQEENFNRGRENAQERLFYPLTGGQNA